ncbi:MAG: hypothetical protein Q4B65_02200 [Candidatus Saccharibacteria bacterium]|nr:hypothetical protein [Candidatus Saccharibacteria bacterium]
MKKTHKRVYGLAGLALVTAMTTYAAILPTPGASAVGETEVTDNIRVRIVGSVPEINFINPDSNIVVYEPDLTLKISYENVEKATLSLHYSAGDGTGTTITNYRNFNPDYVAGEEEVPVTLNYGFGEYTFTLNATGYDGVVDTDAIVITYSSFDAMLEEKDGGKGDVILKYDETIVKHVDIEVYPQGETKWVFKKTLNAPEKIQEIPFYKLTDKTTTFDIVVNAYDDAKVLIGTKTLKYTYKVIPVPNTGALFTGMDISKEDFVVSGFLIFFILSVVAFGVVARNRGGMRRR